MTDNILQNTIFKTGKTRENISIEETIVNTLAGMMTVREVIDERIKKIRIGEEDTCGGENIMQDKKLTEMRRKVDEILMKLVKIKAATIADLKNISVEIIGWKKSVVDEIMRVMMLPEMKMSQKFEMRGECQECSKLEQISFRVENLLTCGERKEEVFTELSILFSYNSFPIILF